MIKAIFIDIDNTLLDFDAYVRHSLETGFKQFGLRQYESWMYDTFKRINDSLWQKLERKEIDFDTLKRIRFECIFKELEIDFDGITFETFFRDQLCESAIPVEGAYELLEALSDKYILCTASNGPFSQQIHRLEIADMLKYFSYNFISEKLGHSKPSKEFFESAFSELNSSQLEKISPDECLIIGDSLTSDIAGGYNYGMKTCFYSHHKNDVTDARIDYFVKNLSDIANLL